MAKKRARRASTPRSSADRYKVRVEDLRWTCDSRSLPFRNTRELKPLRRIVGQTKALKALMLGLEMDRPGYNVFVCGLPGTGRKTSLRHALERVRRTRSRLEDIVGLPRFSAPDQLRFLRMPPGRSAPLRREVDGIFRELARIRDRYGEANATQRRKALRKVVRERLVRATMKFREYPELRRYFKRLGEEIVARDGETYAEDYGIRVLVSRRRGQKPPVHWPSHVSFSTLFGSFEKHRGDDKRPPGIPVGSIRPGALLESRGGFLVLPAQELIDSPSVWNALKHCLMTGHFSFYDHEGHSLLLTSGMDQETLPLDVKVILIGDYQSFDMLQDMDPEFHRAFRIRVDFDIEENRTTRVVRNQFPRVLANLVAEEKLRPLSAAAVAKVIEHAVRRAGRKSKISIQFSAIADLVREADFWAEKRGKRVIGAAEIQEALREGIERVNLLEEKISEMITDGVILIDTAGARVGQVNGLAVYDQGDYLFGKPSRITAETSMGRSGIINIERESGLSGRSHDKGIQILGGYLRSHFAQKRPLSLTASVCFEQSYSGVDGDSASATEIYAILSSLAGLPIRQDIAVTGSLNQKGDIQPIGGVNEKIEGFYDCVQAERATGREGVIIPRRNVPDLMLREDIVQAVKKNRFSIFAIDTVEQGIEILTGEKAGKRRRNGSFPPDSIFARVDRRLHEIAEGMRDFRAEGPGQG